jgi:hypothetical protein
LALNLPPPAAHGLHGLHGFFALAKEHYTIRAEKGSVLLVGAKTLPRGTEIRFLQGDAGGQGGRGRDDD